MIKGLFVGVARLVVDHYTRHPKTDYVSVHVQQFDADDEMLGATDIQVSIEAVDNLVESPKIGGMDAGVAVAVTQATGLPTIPEPVPEPPKSDDAAAIEP